MPTFLEDETPNMTVRPKKAVLDAIKMLDLASEQIERYGWARGTFGNTAIGFCMVGSVHAARGRMVQAERSTLDSAYHYTTLYDSEKLALQTLRKAATEYCGADRSGWSTDTINDRLVCDDDEALEILWLARDALAVKAGV